MEGESQYECEIPSCQDSCLPSRRYDHSPLGALVSFVVVQADDQYPRGSAVSADPVCYTDSKVALYWIRGCNQEWKQFVENQVTSIRVSVPAQHWRHSHWKRKSSRHTLQRHDCFQALGKLNGPDSWLSTSEDLLEGAEVETAAPEECHQEMNSKNALHALCSW